MIDIIGIENLNKNIWTSYQNNKIIVLYFGAEWCGPCKKLKDKIYSLNEQQIMTDVNVLHIDIDDSDNTEISDMYDIQSLPTQIFITLKENKIIELHKIIGYNWEKFENIYNELKK
jgi:thiol-disulfide isomerase/thioredoxin